jgi:2,3-dihydro-2,3-dihydroxybenzoate dehydrogenase
VGKQVVRGADSEYGLTLVTGAASGIGAAVASALVEAGGRVAGLDLDERSLQALARELGPAFVPHRIDLTDEAMVNEAVEHIEDRLGAIQGLVHAAGALLSGALCDSNARRSQLRRLFEVNLESCWLLARAVGPRMARRGGGAIVTVASNAASTPRIGLGLYCASKAASVMLTRCLGLELAGTGVRCNVVSPGSTDTPMLEELLQGASKQALIDGDPRAFRLGIPLGRVARARDVAEVVLFLLSERSRHVTMQELRVDGGATL